MLYVIQPFSIVQLALISNTRKIHTPFIDMLLFASKENFKYLAPLVH